VSLADAVLDAARRFPEAPAVWGPDGRLTYGELDRLANRMARALAARGVGRGDRVAIRLPKSTLAVAAMQAVLRLGAAYVPIDPLGPVDRTRALLADCAVGALVTSAPGAVEWAQEAPAVPTLYLDCARQGGDWGELALLCDGPLPPVRTADDDLAYVLYTSGSSGLPKGVALSHRNALAFAEWARDLLAPTPDDRLANHASLHFDISVLDLYVAFLAGASVHLIPDEQALAPRALVGFLVGQRPTIWYSVPSALVLMIEHGGLLDLEDLSLRALLFAGEPFPIRHLRLLRERWPALRLLNLYGPTETNVCTWHEVGEIDALRSTPVPIGRAACGDRVWVVDERGRPAAPGVVGELLVSGPTVMLGYWGRPPRGEAPYATGDLGRVLPDGELELVGRRDQQVKVRGYRVELGEIEAALVAHPAIGDAAVVAAGSGLDAQLVAFLVARQQAPPSLLQLKQHCAGRLPRYAIIDRARYLSALPRTRNGKVDRHALAGLLDVPQASRR
jgi:amino acid adenylation domain-containing protein